MKILKSIFILLAFATIHSLGNNSIDSLKQSFDQISSRREKFITALELSYDFIEVLEIENSKEYLNYAQEYLDSADRHQMAFYLLVEGQILTFENSYEIAEKKLIEALNIAQQLKDEYLVIESHAVLGSL